MMSRRTRSNGLGPEALEALDAVGGGRHLEAGRAEPDRGHLADRRVILDEQDPGVHDPPSSPALRRPGGRARRQDTAAAPADGGHRSVALDRPSGGSAPVRRQSRSPRRAGAARRIAGRAVSPGIRRRYADRRRLGAVGAAHRPADGRRAGPFAGTVRPAGRGPLARAMARGAPRAAREPGRAPWPDAVRSGVALRSRPARLARAVAMPVDAVRRIAARRCCWTAAGSPVGGPRPCRHRRRTDRPP